MAKEVSMIFNGVKVADGFMTGTVSSRELIENFSKSWIPVYQRERVQNRKKIKTLIEIFQKKGRIDSLKLNLKGEYVTSGDKALLEGKISVIDGQQRLLALVDSGVKDILIPIELYINLSDAEEIQLFHQFNRSPTKLTFGELAKSSKGAYGQLMQRILRRREYPFNVTVNQNRFGVSLSMVSPVVAMAHKKRFDKVTLNHVPTGKRTLEFFEEDHPAAVVSMTDFVVKNIFESFTKIFGDYDAKSICYRRSFFLAYCKVVNQHFITDTGKVDFGKFGPRFREMPLKLLSRSVIREAVGHSSHDAIFDVETVLVDYLNHKLKTGHLPTPKRKVFEDETEEAK